MKRIISTILIIFLALPCFAGNVLQQQDELKLIQTHFSKTYVPVKSDSVYLIKEDYQVYLEKGDSLYGRFTETFNDIKKSNIPNKQLNLKYLGLLLNKLNTVIGVQDSSFNNQMFTNAGLSKIIIDDSDYVKLTPKVKEYINSSNIMIFK